MKTLGSLLALTLTLLTCQCARPEYDDRANAAPALDPTPAAPAAPAPPSPAARAASDAPAAVRVPIDGLPAIGSARALVTIVAFSDYQCPYCAKADRTLATLREELGEDLRIVLANRPLPMHDDAAPAARALLAAAEQGRAEAMHARLFADRGALDDAGLVASARAIGLDVRAFDAARKGPSTAKALAISEALANQLGATGTPTFFVNGRRLLGARPYEQFRALVDEELAKAREIVAGGVPRERVYATILASSEPSPAPTRQPDADDAVVDVALAGAPVRGARTAPVTVTVFSDFECPYCVKLEATLGQLEKAYPGKVRVAFKHNPLPMHEHARLAAKAAIAADAQGRFWEYHDVLVAHRDALGRDALRQYATEAGLELARFDRDLADPRTEARLVADEKQAARLHVDGTPTTFVNGRRVVGAQPIATFRAAVDRALASPR
ncbi:MAG: thioredoxin domain-containing protein [Labilithrix sp.]|nr:thioredoxin domain-containing protein [Labilithrix sp.]